MSLQNLENLVKTGQLKTESFDQKEFNGLVNSGKARLKDARNETLAPESRFDLAYNAAHSFSLAALRYHGYRTDKRYVVFQVLPFTLNIDSIASRILSKCHDSRNLAEYEGYYNVDTQLFSELLSATQILLNQIELIRCRVN